MRSIVSSSTGGNACAEDADRAELGGRARRRAASRISGAKPMHPERQAARRAAREARTVGADGEQLELRHWAPPHQEDPTPAQLGELALVGVEHERTRCL